MKKILLYALVFFIFLLQTKAQQGTVYAEFYSEETGKVFLADTYELFLFDNVMGLNSLNDSVEVAHNGFHVKLIFIYKDAAERTAFKYYFEEGEKGICRLRMWDNLLYGYCYVSEINIYADCAIINLVGRKNVPQRKKLLFKDSPTLRMWKYPWVGE